MPSLPPIPPWNAAHVILVHFPIGILLLAAPALLFFAMLIPKASRVLLAAAALLFVMGTAGLWVAAKSGGAAYDLAKSQGALDVPEIAETINEHAHMGNEAKNYFTIFTAILLVYTLIFSAGRARIAPGVNIIVLLLFLGGAGWLAILLANTAHEGGEVVHVHGITAPLEGGGGAEEAAEAASDDGGGGGSSGAESGNSGSGSENSGSGGSDNSGSGNADSAVDVD